MRFELTTPLPIISNQGAASYLLTNEPYIYSSFRIVRIAGLTLFTYAADSPLHSQMVLGTGFEPVMRLPSPDFKSGASCRFRHPSVSTNEGWYPCWYNILCQNPIEQNQFSEYQHDNQSHSTLKSADFCFCNLC